MTVCQGGWVIVLQVENITVDIDGGIHDFQQLAIKWGQGFVKGYCHAEPIIRECNI